jgi:glycosyltransferase involved in cell wall biosynthesis
MWHVCQGRSIRDSACFHVTCDAERAEVRAAKLRGPIAVIPCGIDIPELTPLSRQSSGPRRVLFLGRVHPTKGVDTLIRAWRSVQHRASDWELQIAGPDNDGYLPKMRKLAMSLGAERISFAGPVYGQEKGKMYQQADVFVLPTHSENFGISVAEALSYGVPVIVTRGAPWAGIEQRRCGWWIENNQESLSDCLRQVTGMRSEDLFTWGGRGRVWMANDFSWRQVGRMMYETYLWILGGGTPPAWVTPAQRSSVRATLNPQQKA